MTVLSETDYLTAFGARRDLARKLLDLTADQEIHINNGDFTQLLSVLGRKQRVLLEMEDHKMRNAALLRHWRAKRDELDDEIRGDCEHLLAETDAILAELLTREQTSTDQLTSGRDSERKRARNTSTGSQVRAAYGEHFTSASHSQLDIDR